MVSKYATLVMSVIPVRGSRLGETARLMTLATIRDRRRVSASVVGPAVHTHQVKAKDIMVDMTVVSTLIFEEIKSVGAADPQGTS